MEAKWPFLLLTFALLCVVGFTIMTLEKTAVMNNWAEKRCELPILFTASFFKPDTFPGTSSDFAKDNFSFCTKSYVDKFMKLFMSPFTILLSQQTSTTSSALGSLNSLRNISFNMYSIFASVIESFYKKFASSAFQLSRIMQHIRMAVGRLNAVMMSMVYAGIAVFRSILNAIQSVIRVVLIICGIMLIIIIILWFFLWPVIPIILATLAAIVSVVAALSMVLSASLGTEASNDMGGFCFAEGTPVAVKTKDGAVIIKPVQEIVTGDELAENCGTVTTVIQMDGKDIPLYNVKGIYVSGSHLIKGADGIWKSVAKDERAVLSTKKSPIIYCFNTSSNMIPLMTKDNTPLFFRDWEEIDNVEEATQKQWNRMIFEMLNPTTPFTPEDEKPLCNDALIGPNVRIKTSQGFVPISSITLSSIITDAEGKDQPVKGMIWGTIDNADDTDTIIKGTWITDVYYKQDNMWKNGKGRVSKGTTTLQGMSLMTEDGTLTIWDEVSQKELIIRDFTEVGYQMIHETYAFVDTILRTREPPQ
jgi:hypothetical protein